MRRLYWFQNDLRLADNPGLAAQAEGEQLLLLYLWPRQRPWCHQNEPGPQRQRFLVESVRALREALAALGQDLLVLQGSPELVIPQLVEQLRIDRVATARIAISHAIPHTSRIPGVIGRKVGRGGGGRMHGKQALRPSDPGPLSTFILVGDRGISGKRDFPAGGCGAVA